MEGFENFIGLNPWTALFTLCNLVITFLILRKFLFKPVKKMIDSRQKEIDDLYADAGAAKSEAEAMRSDYEQKLLEARQTSAEILRQAQSDADAKGEEILRQARSDADALRDKARSDIALEKKKALNDIKSDISQIALDIAEKVVEKEINAADQQALIEEFIRNMGDEV
ncbi:MAG: F0F1 ATP synthase subunit B [Oscillospiraceae bacterium]|nr:F0F1 ATP synthase subunit B [Oscillospiraceae bacterium]MBQ8930576.1 F0F1 ATP synthase subunit B [Oscillospiraceae bacterium]